MKYEIFFDKIREINMIQYIKDKSRKLLGISIIFLILGSTTLFFIMLKPKDINFDKNSSIDFEVKTGCVTKKIAQDLEDQGLIKDSSVFTLFVKMKGMDNKIKAGKYSLNPSMTPEQILTKLVSGDTIKNEEKVTIPEGTQLKKIAKILSDHKLTTEKEFCEAAKAGNFKDKYEFLRDLSDDTSLEGFLFPDTYLLPKNKTPKFYIDIFLSRFEEVYIKENNFDEKEQKIGLKAYQIVTLASIIEAEAKLESEKPIIASVFNNRLQKGMPLQSCSTVNYALGKHKEKLSTNDTEFDSLYNTYIHVGLPPGPICSPGLSAIRAVIHPKKSEYLYFVSNGDGSHTFSKTYNEHINAKNAIGNIR